jgi:hypothetical protein
MPANKGLRLGLKSRALLASKRRAPSKKLAISFDGRLAAEVHRAAQKQASGNVSAWLAEAARDRLRLENGRQLLKEYEAEHGPIAEHQIAEVEREWPQD